MACAWWELAAAALFAAQGANGCRIDFGLAFTNVCKGWPPFPCKLMYLTVQCHVVCLLYGLAWAANALLCPEWAGGLLLVATPLACGLAWFVAFNYYALLHHNPELAKTVAKDSENRELIFGGRHIVPDEFFRLMNWDHLPYAALGGIPLLVNRRPPQDKLLSTSETMYFCIAYGVAYASVLNGVKICFDFWVYPFLAEMPRAWQHVLFYCVSFGQYFTFCAVCRTLMLSSNVAVLVVLEGTLAVLTITVLLITAVRELAARRAAEPDTDSDSESESSETETDTETAGERVQDGPEKEKQ